VCPWGNRRVPERTPVNRPSEGRTEAW
jgi:hypothetical protein